MQVNPNKLTTADFYFGQTLGEGAYARVVHAKLKLNPGVEFAVKIMDKSHIKKENKVKYVMMEKAVLAKLTHPFVLKLFYTFQDTGCLYLCMEMLHGGELLQHINRCRKEKEKRGIADEACDFAVAQFYLAEAVEAVEFMHAQNVIHRDLKPENLLIAASGHLRVGDFGTAMLMKTAPKEAVVTGSGGFGEGLAGGEGNHSDGNDENEGGGDGDSDRGSFVGTAEYVSPEVLQDLGVSPAADLWALGCIAYQLLVGRPPLRGESEYLTFQRILAHCDGTQPLEYPAAVTRDPGVLGEAGVGADGVSVAQSFISQLLKPNAADRYGADDGADAAAQGQQLVPPCAPGEVRLCTTYTLKRHGLFRGIMWETLAKSAMEPLPGTVDAGASAGAGAGAASSSVAPAESAPANAPPYVPDPATFPSSATEKMFDGASDDWQLGVEPTLLSDSGRSRSGSGTGVAGLGGGLFFNIPSSASGLGQSTVADKEKWRAFLGEGEGQVMTGTVYKRKGLFSKRRQLILTDRPRLLYVDAEKMELKGQVPWTYQFPVQCNLLSDKQFDIVASMTGRAYHMTAVEAGTAQMWVDLIAAMVERQQEAGPPVGGAAGADEAAFRNSD